MRGATEQECYELIGRMTLPSHPEVCELDTNDWTIVVIFGGAASDEEKRKLLEQLPSGWFAAWRDTEYRGEICQIRKEQ